MYSVTSCLGVILFILLSVAFFSVFERKMMASVQSRVGPNKVFVSGFLQPMSDALKLVTKVESTPSNSMSLVYILSPAVMFIVSTVVWILFPVKWGFFQSEVGMLILMVYFSITVYGVIFTGWGSNSRYATLGCVRSISQSISYEIGLSFVMVIILLFNTTFVITETIFNQKNIWTAFLFPSLFFGFIVCLFSESSRTPFDLPEGESELVSGFNVEYGGSKYTLIFLGENLALLWASVVTSTLFLGGEWAIFVVILFVWVRASFPRVRYDKMVGLFWLVILPLTIGLGGLGLPIS